MPDEYNIITKESKSWITRLFYPIIVICFGTIFGSIVIVQCTRDIRKAMNGNYLTVTNSIKKIFLKNSNFLTRLQLSV